MIFYVCNLYKIGVRLLPILTCPVGQFCKSWLPKLKMGQANCRILNWWCSDDYIPHITRWWKLLKIIKPQKSNKIGKVCLFHYLYMGISFVCVIIVLKAKWMIVMFKIERNEWTWTVSPTSCTTWNHLNRKGDLAD